MTHATSLSLVRYAGNDYSVPTAYGHRQVLVKGYVDEVVICHGSQIIARHARCYGKEEAIYDPLHYLALLERKTNALGQAAPLQGWGLPAEFERLRRLLESRQAKDGNRKSRYNGQREYIQVLRLLECFECEVVTRAIGDALHLGAVSFDAVKHLVLCRLEGRPARLDLSLYPHLPVATVATTATADYMALLNKEGSR